MVTALLAGGLAGLFASAVQTWRVVPLIHEAELYEQSSAAHGHPGVAHEHANHEAAAKAAPAEGHSHDGSAWAPADGVERTLFTVAANLLTGIGFASLLVGAIALSSREPDAREGVLWGLASFGAFSMAPAVGLPPELPGMIAGELVARQAWWALAAAATAAGIALMVFVRQPWAKAAAVALLVLPHAIGAPDGGSGGSVPPELVARFVTNSLAATGLFWLVLGGAVGGIYRRLRD
jgi:cobalt transporter subunit CbtA